MAATRKVGAKSLKNPGSGESRVINAFEDNFDLLTFVKYHHRNSEVGASLLKKHSSESYQVVFGFHCRGVAPFLSEEELLNVLGGIRAFDDFPEKESLTIHFALLSEDQDRQNYFNQQIQQVPRDLGLLLGATAKRIHDLTDRGVRQVSRLKLYVTVTFNQGVQKGQGDIFDNWLIKAERIWFKAIGAEQEVQAQSREKILIDAYQGFNRWFNLLANQVGLSVSPMSLEEVIFENWRRLNPNCEFSWPPISSFAHVVCNMDAHTFTEHVTQVHPLSRLIEDQIPNVDGRDRIEIIAVFICMDKTS